MSYWSLRRTAERAAAGHELARAHDDTLAPTKVRLPDWTPVAAELHPASVTSPSRTLRQRAADLEKSLWTVPTADPADLDHSGTRLKARTSW